MMPTHEKLEEVRWTTLEHTSYCPDLSPCDYHIFGPLKEALGGERLGDDAGVEACVCNWLETFYDDGIFQSVGLTKARDYVEKTGRHCEAGPAVPGFPRALRIKLRAITFAAVSTTKVYRVYTAQQLEKGCGATTRTQKQVCEIFNTEYPDRRISQSTVSRIENKFREFGNVTDIPGRDDDEQKLDILLDIQDNPHKPIRQVAVDNDVSKTSILRLLKNEKYLPYKIHLVQELNDDDPDRQGSDTLNL
ncbi:hypothetical protein NQ318_005242 [Aromia moschata]|uniref:DUF4817 domain-containing protein n=1 Tax=Aromia moschata TaxID=1265417 RepID=A0AAV8Y4A6_9CUCU|nr:hypothetical protein NQ318_005242 [Aromia moschata]